MAGTQKSNNGLSRILADFLNDRRSQNLSPKSIRFYHDKIGGFIGWCALNGVNEIQDVTADMIRSYILHLQEMGHTPGGVHAYFRSIRAFMYFYEYEYEPENWRNPIRKVKAPKVVDEPLQGVGIENVKLLLDACEKDTPMGQRNRTMLLLLLETGVRAQELLAINVEDVDFSDSSILIRQGKGRKPRTVFMGATARRNLRKHMRNIPERGALFLNREGERLKYGGLRETLKRLSAKAGLPPVSIHSFRRTFALEQLRRGVDLFTISRLMGHTSLQVLSRYLKQSKEDLGTSYKSIVDS